MIKSALRITALLSALYGSVAYGQNAQPVIPLTGSPLTPVSGSNPLPVSGTFSATLGGFQPDAAGARGTPLAVTTSDSSGALPTGTVDVVSNVGSFLMYCNVNGVAATASDQPITSGGGWFAFTIPTGITTLHCIAPSGATTANIVGGTGLPTGTGGGGGGGSGSGAVFGPTAAGSAAANPPVIVGGTVDGTAAGNVANWKVVGGIGSVNTAQVNGVTTSTGAGAVGTGTQRFAVGQDATTLAGTALGLTIGSPLFVDVTNPISLTTGAAVIGSISNTTFASTQSGTWAVQESGIWTVQPGNTANTTAWLVTGTGGTFPATQSGAWNITNITGTVSLPTGAATAANQTNAGQKTQIVDGSGNVIASTSNNLNVQCANCSGSGVSTADAASFTAGASLFAGSGGEYTSGGATACVTGHQCMVAMTASRAMFTDTTTWAGTTLGAPSNYGTSPGAVAVPGVNAFITNTPTVSVPTWAGGTLGSMANYGTSPGAVLVPGVNAFITNTPNVAVTNTPNVAAAIADGADVTLGAKADAVCGTATGTCSLEALVKFLNVAAAAGTAATGAAVPSSAIYVAMSQGGNLTGMTGTSGSLNVNVTNSTALGRAAASGSSPVVQPSAPSTAGAIVPNNTTAVVVKASAAVLMSAQLFGIGSVPAYLKIYNATSATCGSGTPVKRLMIPAAPTAANGSGMVQATFGPGGLALGTGFTYCVTTGIADNDTTAPAATTYLVNLDYE